MEYPFTEQELQAAHNAWGDIPGFPSYRAGRDGSIWSNKSGSWRRRKAKENGRRQKRLQISLCRQGVKYSFFVHQLIMLAFVGPCPEGMEVAHEDGDPTNNRLSNLRYDTHKGNHSDRKRHGTNNAGEKNGQAKMTKEDVLKARERFARGEGKAALMSDYKIGRRGIERILRKERWTHV